MDLVTEMLTRALQTNHASEVSATRIRPSMKPRFSRLPWLSRKRAAFNADRLVNRMWDYPRTLRPRVAEFDYFHVGDHSYAQLAHELPAARTGVYCHDLDAFRCLLGSERRPRWFRALARRILKGMQRAAVVFHSTLAVRRQIEQHGLIDPARLVHAPYGTAAEFAPAPVESSSTHDQPFLLHVGSCIPRKRIDTLLDVFAAIHGQRPELRLVQVGGEWTSEQRAQLDRLSITSAVSQVRGLDRAVLADYYRRATLVLQPSEAEGFGLPVIEALACGAPVLASDISALREVGGAACGYCPVGDVSAWVARVDAHLQSVAVIPDRSARLAQAERYSWAAHARTILQAYLTI